MTSMEIAQKHLPFSLKWIKALVSVVILIIGSVFVYLEFGKGPVQENILYLTAVPIIAIVAYLLARTWAPIEIKQKYRGEIEALKNKNEALEEKLRRDLTLTIGETSHFYETLESEHTPTGSYWITVCRVKATNASASDSIHGVTVKMESIEPYLPGLSAIPLALPIKSSPGGERNNIVDLSPSEGEWFDVVSHADSTERFPYLELGGIAGDHNYFIPHHRTTVEFKVQICAYGRDTPSASEYFMIGWRNGRPFLENYVAPLSASQITRKPQDPDTPHSSTQGIS